MREFMSVDGVIDTPTWTFDYGFGPRMGAAIGAGTARSGGILLGRTTYPLTRGPGPRLFPAEAEPRGLTLTATDAYENGVAYLANRGRDGASARQGARRERQAISATVTTMIATSTIVTGAASCSQPISMASASRRPINGVRLCTGSATRTVFAT